MTLKSTQRYNFVLPETVRGEMLSSLANDYKVLGDFYDHFKRPGDNQLSYWQIEGCQFENEEHRKELVNLTIWDYCNRIKTFAKK